jgi:methylmalonyl-CoA mutase N-terminal domain/subunit
MNDEIERLRMEVVVAFLNYCPRIGLKRLMKIMKMRKTRRLWAENLARGVQKH